MARSTKLILACALALSCVANATATAEQGQAAVRRTGLWQPPLGLQQIPIWPNGAPDMEGVSQPAESVLTAQTPNAIGGSTSEAVFDVTSPTMTVFPPKGR